MGVIEDVRKVVQDLVTPDLKAQAALIHGNESNSKLRDEALSAKIDAQGAALTAKIDAQGETLAAKIDERYNSLRDLIEGSIRALNAKVDSNHATVIYALNIDKRLEALESDRQRSQQPERRAEIASAASS
jgi:hypothetical protein